MPFVKLDCGILDSTLWINREQREIFITALLMAEPREIKDPVPQLEVCSINETGFVVPPGWYGFIAAAGMGIIRRAMLSQADGTQALVGLGQEDPESRSKDFGGRRLVRVDGGYLVLNFIKYRDRDYGAAERMRKLRERRRNDSNVPPNVTHAEAEAEAEAETDKNPPTPLPEGLSAVAWGRWLQYRRDIKKPLKEASYEAAQKAMLKFGVNQEAVVEQSIANGYQGLFDLKNAPATTATGKPDTVRLFVPKDDGSGELDMQKFVVADLKPWEQTKLAQLRKQFKSKTIFYRTELNDRS